MLFKETEIFSKLINIVFFLFFFYFNLFLYIYFIFFFNLIYFNIDFYLLFSIATSNLKAGLKHTTKT
jgi:hypothetical protein